MCLKSAFLFLASGASIVLATQEKYTTKWDNIDLDDILHTERLLEGYIKCLMVRGPCTPDGRDLRDILPDALETECAKCSERQKNGAEKVINFLIDNKHAKWEELKAKYDPTGQYEKRLSERRAKETTPSEIEMVTKIE